MSKIETTSELPLKLICRINLRRRVAPTARKGLNTTRHPFERPRKARPAAPDPTIRPHNHQSPPPQTPPPHRRPKNATHHTDGKNEWPPPTPPVTPTAKPEPTLAPTPENNPPPPQSLHPKANRNCIGPSKKHLQYFNFEANFLENENFFQKTELPFFS